MVVASKLIVASKLASKLASVLRHELQLQCLAVASLPTYYFTQSSLVASLASWPHLSSHAKAAWQQAHKLTSSQAGRESCCCCAALASPQAPPSAGQSSAERWWVLAGVPAQAGQRGNVVLDGNAGLQIAYNHHCKGRQKQNWVVLEFVRKGGEGGSRRIQYFLNQKK